MDMVDIIYEFQRMKAANMETSIEDNFSTGKHDAVVTSNKQNNPCENV